MKLGHVALFAAVLGLATLAPRAADAGSEFTHTLSHEHSAKTSLKGVEPTGFKVAIVQDGKTVEDTVPHVFQLPDADAYVPVTITSPEGKSWTGKIEVKARKQAVLNFKFSPEPAAEKAKSARKFIGYLKNTTHNCTASKDRVAVKFELLDENGAVAHTVVLEPNRQQQAEVPQGTYDVRIYVRDRQQWVYRTTHPKLEVTKDKWEQFYGCERR